MKEKLKWIPNILCVIRIALVFVFVYLALQENDIMLYCALGVFLLAGITDVLDGYLARKNNWITEVGKILDPLADKMMQCTALVVLSIRGILPIWFAVVFIVKELATLIIGLFVIKKRNVVVVSKWYGKTTVCLFYATVALSIIFKTFLEQNPLIYALLFVPASVFGICAFVAYFRHYYSSLRKKKEKFCESEGVKESV